MKLKAGHYMNRYISLGVRVPGSVCGLTDSIVVRPTPGPARYATTTSQTNVGGIKDLSKDRISGALATYTATPRAERPFDISWLPKGFSKYEINAVYQGKGSPEWIEATLLLVACYDPASGARRKTPWSSQDALETALARHCEGRIGLDCLGFAVHYLSETQRLALDGVKLTSCDMHHITGRQPGVPMRNQLKEVDDGDVLVYLLGEDFKAAAKMDPVSPIPPTGPPRHIAVVSTLPNAVSAYIAESFGGPVSGWPGPQAAEVGLARSKAEGKLGAVFKITRGQITRLCYVVPGNMAAPKGLA